MGIRFRMPIDVEAVHRSLEARVGMERFSLEAAGEERWSAEVGRDLGLLSTEDYQEMIQVIDAWLAAKIGVPIEEVGPYAMVAAGYARFLAARVSLGTNPNPMVTLEDAWREWRETAEGP